MAITLDDKVIDKWFSFRASGYDVNELKRQFVKHLWTIHFWTTGRNLIEAIINRTGFAVGATLTVEYIARGCDYKSDETLFWDPDFVKTRFNVVQEPTQATVLAQHKEYVYVFHELLHYYHDLCDWWFQGSATEEFKTVGIYEYSNEALSENALRREMGLPRRPCYYYNNPNEEETSRRQKEGLITDTKKILPADKECSFTYSPSMGKGASLQRTPPRAAFALRGVGRRGPGPLGRG